MNLCSTSDSVECSIFSRSTTVTKVTTQQSIRILLNSNFQLLLLLSMAMICTVLNLILKTSGSGDRATAETPECEGRDGDDDIDDKKYWSWPLFRWSYCCWLDRSYNDLFVRIKSFSDCFFEYIRNHFFNVFLVVNNSNNNDDFLTFNLF